MQAQTKEAPGEFGGLVEKIKTIRKYYRDTVAAHTDVRTWAEAAAGRGQRYDQAVALFHEVKSKVNYVGDPDSAVRGPDIDTIELIKSPWTMVDEIESRGFSAGDCDDQASLNYTLLKSIGFPAFLRVIWLGNNDMPSHIYAMAQIDGEDIAFDTCAPDIGVQRPDIKQYADFD